MTISEYNTLVDLHADGLYRFMLKKSADQDEAKDLVQETFSKVWVKRENVAFEKGKSYLFSTAFNTFIDYTRRQAKFGEYDETKFETKSESNHHSDLKEVIEEALQRLPDIQKTVLLLRDYEGYDYAEIGKITDLSESQVKVYIFRARKEMKKYLVSIDLVI